MENFKRFWHSQRYKYLLVNSCATAVEFYKSFGFSSNNITVGREAKAEMGRIKYENAVLMECQLR
jgi:uncharacterized glyoxalase superfamily protein PhnB